MRYSLWSQDRLVGYTDLDIPTVTATMRQGFVEPTPEGRPLLEDATGVWRAMAAREHSRRARGADEASEADDELVIMAMNRREALELQLRDEDGEVFQSDFIRVYDLFDIHTGIVEEMSGTEEEQEVAFEIYLSRLGPEERAEALAQRAATEAEIEEFVAEMREDWKEAEMFGSGWPPEDPRWDTMQYHLQVYLNCRVDEDLEVPDFEGWQD